MTEDVKKLSFEDALEELEKIVKQLEEGRIPLDTAVSVYERGVQLRGHCEAKLKDASSRIDKIIESPEGGNLSLIPLDEQGA